jgi:hypothetical protein
MPFASHSGSLGTGSDDRSGDAVRQRADLWNTMGSPKSASAKREIPLAPIVVNGGSIIVSRNPPQRRALTIAPKPSSDVREVVDSAVRGEGGDPPVFQLTDWEPVPLAALIADSSPVVAPEHSRPLSRPSCRDARLHLPSEC